MASSVLSQKFGVYSVRSRHSTMRTEGVAASRWQGVRPRHSELRRLPCARARGWPSAPWLGPLSGALP